MILKNILIGSILTSLMACTQGKFMYFEQYQGHIPGFDIEVSALSVPGDDSSKAGALPGGMIDLYPTTANGTRLYSPNVVISGEDMNGDGVWDSVSYVGYGGIAGCSNSLRSSLRGRWMPRPCTGETPGAFQPLARHQVDFALAKLEEAQHLAEQQGKITSR